MKKLLLTLAALFALTGASAATLVMKDLLGTENVNPFASVTSGDFTITASKAEGSTDPAYFANGYDMRIYADNTLTISAKEDMTEIVFTLASNKTRYTYVTASEGTVTKQTEDDTTVTWTGSAKSVTFTVGHDAELGSDGPSKRGQFRFTQIDITGGGNAGTVVTPDPNPDPQPGAEVDDIAAWITKGDTNNAVTIKGSLTAVYQNGNALYVKDNSGWLLVYGSIDQTYNNGDIIPGGVSGKFVDYNGLPEMSSPAGFAAATAGTPVEPIEIMASDINTYGLSTYVKLTDVTISEPDEKGRTFPANDGSDDFTIYNSYPNSVTIPTGEGYTVYGFVSIYKDSYQITAIEVVNESGVQTVATPRFNPAAGAVAAGTAVEITCGTADATIHYTTDGTEPTSASAVYSTAIVVNEAMTIKAIAVKEGMADSAVATAAYTIAAVIEPGDDITFKAPGFEDVEGTELVNNDGSTTATGNQDPESCLDGETFTSGNVTIEFVHGEDVNYYTGAYNDHVRWMQGNSIVVTPAEGYAVVRIFVQTAPNSKGNFTAYQNGVEVGTVDGAGTGVESPITWTGDVTGSVTLTSNKQVRFRYMTIGLSENGAVEAVEVDTDAPVEYYNLQGVRVAEPANGLYIRRQGNTATKVVIR